jgi:hypothetical protein
MRCASRNHDRLLSKNVALLTAYAEASSAQEDLESLLYSALTGVSELNP